ncbi:hypothetical protein E4U25_006743 [Claviceps purpurea]|nr:hypothetical protein E4U25_006743 [Claviceps purpurea]
MAFFEDPRMRQRWNRIAHDAETVTENAAAGIFAFSQNYITPCFSSMADSIEQCTTMCLGDPEDRLRRKRERQRARDNAEFSFDFYDDWYQDERTGGLLGHWGSEDWDRLLAGTGAVRKHGGGDTTEQQQPRRKRGMSYGTRGARRKPNTAEDPTIIPSTQPIGFLSRLPWKMGGTLRYKPSAADLQDHPGKHDEEEAAPLLGSSGDHDNDGDESDYGHVRTAPRQRSGTTGSGGTSDSYRSRGDLFPSDGEGEEDAIPLDDDVTYDMIRRDDRSSGRTISSDGKRPPARFAPSRTVSRSTFASTTTSADSPVPERMTYSQPVTPEMAQTPTTDHLHAEEGQIQRQEQYNEQQARRSVPEQYPSEQPERDGNSDFDALLPADDEMETKPDTEVRADEKDSLPSMAPQYEEQRQPLSLPLHSPEPHQSVQKQSQQIPTRREDVGGSREPRQGSQNSKNIGLERNPSQSSTDPSFHAARLPRFG